MKKIYTLLTSFVTAFCCVHQYAVLFVFLFTFGISNAWGADYTYSLPTGAAYSGNVVYYGNGSSSATITTSITGTKYEWSNIQVEDGKLKNNMLFVEVPSATVQGIVTFVCQGSNTGRWLYVYNSSDEQDVSRKMPYCGSGKVSGVAYSASDIITVGGKYYIKFGTEDDFKINSPITLYVSASTGGEGGGEGACTNPDITTQPENKSVSTGQTALLACAADKGTYQWYNATDNTAAGTGSADTQVTGGTGCNAGGWTTPAFNVVGVYSYYCVITDGECSVKTNTVTITVNDATTPPPTPEPGAEGCVKWEGNPSSLSDGKMTVGGNLLLSVSDGVSIETGAVWNGSGNITIFKIGNSEKYVQGKFVDNSLINTVTIGAATNQSEAQNYAVAFCRDENFTSNVIVHTYQAPSANAAKDETKLLHEFTAPIGARYFRIYRKFTYGGVVYGDGQTIRVYSIEACPKECTSPTAPTALTTTSVGKKSATLTITDDETPVSYDVYYSTSSTAPGPTTAATATTTEKVFKLTGLTPETTYYAWVRAVCDESYKSEWIALTGGSFTTGAIYTGATYQYILGSCYVVDGEWTQGSDGKVDAWLYNPKDGNLLATDDILFDASTGGIYFNSKDLNLLDDPDLWGASSGSNRAIKALKVESDKTITFDLGTLQATKITFYVFPNSNDNYTIDMTLNGVTTQYNTGTSQQHKWHKYDFEDDTYTGQFSITSHTKETRVVVIVHIPQVTITYNANGGSGNMDADTAPCGVKVNLSLNKFHKPGMQFGGWTLNADGTGEVIADGAQFATTKDVILYAKWITPCEAQPTIKVYNPNITIWDGESVDLTLASATFNFDTTGIKYTYSITSESEAISGCKYQFFDDQFHIQGIPNIGNTAEQKVTLTLTLTNDCPTPQTVQVEQNITILPKDQKARIALILTGKEGGGFNEYTEANATACAGLIDYLDDFYSITCVNGYATKDETEIANYYKNYDLLIVTDFLDTGEGYTNAIGTLIDKKPILSFEAYVAGENGSNWHIGSNPVDPSPKVQKMKILCAGHTIFGDDIYEGNEIEVVQEDTTVQVLSSLSEETKAKGLQGFTINNAPDFLFLATIRDTTNNRDLIVCCERQVVFTGRLMIYGINFYEMDNLSPAGKIIMRQMIDYLLLTDETALADCALVFDNGGKDKPAGSGDHLWSNPKNWYPGRNIVPTPYHPTRIIAECHVDTEDAHAGSVKINRGETALGDKLEGKIIIRPNAGLTVAGFVYRVNNIRYAVPLQTVEEDILIQANATHNGALVYGNKDSDVHATVQYYSKGEGSSTANPVWQYIGTPLQADKTAISMYYKAWMCRWTNASDGSLGGLWQWVENEDVLEPFEGYCITQEAPKTYTLAGKLNQPVTQRIILDNRDPDGYAFAANSWTAPIKIQEMADGDFTNAEKSIYIYYTGSYKEWQEGQPDINDSIVTKRGQYGVVPIHSAPYVAGADSVIPAMQGFFIKTTANAAYVDLVYNRVVYDSKYFKTSTEPMRVAARDSKPEVLKMELKGPRSGDKLYMLMRSDFNEQFIDGWDGRKIEGDPNVPMLAVIKECGNMAVAAVEQANNHYLTFRAGKDSTYTFSFEYDSEQPLYLYDQLAQKSTEIKTGNTYTFAATNNTPLQRFLISDTPYEVPTSITLVETENSLHFENYGNQLVNVRIVDMQGRVVYTCNTTDEIVDIQPSLPLGVYLAHITMGNDSKVVRLIGKETK